MSLSVDPSLIMTRKRNKKAKSIKSAFLKTQNAPQNPPENRIKCHSIYVNLGLRRTVF